MKTFIFTYLLYVALWGNKKSSHSGRIGINLLIFRDITS